MAYAKHCGHEPILLDFDAAPSAADAGGGGGGGGKQPKPAKAPEKAKKEHDTPEGGTLLRIQHKKADDPAAWYPEVILRSEMIDYYDISGCYILRPWSFAIWEQIQKWFDGEIKKMGV